MSAASVPSGRSGRSTPPAATIVTSGPAICLASSTTLSASWALCETITIPTIAFPPLPRAPPPAVPRSAQPVGPVQDLHRVHRGAAGAVGDLPPARLAVADGQVGTGGADVTEQPAADLHGDVVLLPFEPVGAGDAATGPVQLDHPELGNQPEQVQRRLADVVPLLLAWRVVGDRERKGPEIGLQLPRHVQLGQELADVVGLAAHHPQV